MKKEIQYVLMPLGLGGYHVNAELFVSSLTEVFLVTLGKKVKQKSSKEIQSKALGCLKMVNMLSY